MKIGIIGAGIAGLAAGRELSKAGHEVTVIEKSREYGGRLATRYAGKDNMTKIDHGTPCFTAKSPEFRGFVAELLEKELIKIWGDNSWRYDGIQLLDYPLADNEIQYTAVDGMNSIGKFLARWVDVQTDIKAGGLTYFGTNRRKKRPWMINLANYNTFEADAVIVATPAPQAYSIILTTQDEVDTLKLIREIDEISYDSTYTLLAGYGKVDVPPWEMIKGNDEVIQIITNEKTKKESLPETALVVHSTPEFAKNNKNLKPEEIGGKMLDSLADIVGNWALTPEWSNVHYWRFSKPKRVISRPFMEFEGLDAPLALIGDYFEGSTVDHAYCSGIRLARHWLEKYSD